MWDGLLAGLGLGLLLLGLWLLGLLLLGLLGPLGLLPDLLLGLLLDLLLPNLLLLLPDLLLLLGLLDLLLLLLDRRGTRRVGRLGLLWYGLILCDLCRNFGTTDLYVTKRGRNSKGRDDGRRQALGDLRLLYRLERERRLLGELDAQHSPLLVIGDACVHEQDSIGAFVLLQCGHDLLPKTLKGRRILRGLGPSVARSSSTARQ